MNSAVLSQLTALKAMSVPDLKARWQELFDSPPPPYNRRFLESRLSYRIQELEYGGLSEGAVERLDVNAAVRCLDPHLTRADDPVEPALVPEVRDVDPEHPEALGREREVVRLR